MRNSKIRRAILGVISANEHLLNKLPYLNKLLINPSVDKFVDTRIDQQEQLLADIEGKTENEWRSKPNSVKKFYSYRAMMTAIDTSNSLKNVAMQVALSKKLGDIPIEQRGNASITEEEIESIMEKNWFSRFMMNVGKVGELFGRQEIAQLDEFPQTFRDTVREHAFNNFTELTGIQVIRKKQTQQ